MGTDNEAEACGRCSMSSVVSVASEGRGGRPGPDPYAGGHIEVDDDELRSVSRHVVALGSVKDRLDRWASALTYGR